MVSLILAAMQQAAMQVGVMQLRVMLRVVMVMVLGVIVLKSAQQGGLLGVWVGPGCLCGRVQGLRLRLWGRVC